MKKIITTLIFLISLWGLFGLTFASASAGEEMVNVILFMRDDCGHCHQEIDFLENWQSQHNFSLTKFDVETKEGKEYFKSITNKFNLSRVTPISLIGDDIIIGFNQEQIKNAINKADEEKKFNLELNYYLSGQNLKESINDSACDTDSESQGCSIENFLKPAVQDDENNIKVVTNDNVSFLGHNINLKGWSLFSLSTILGFIDGFNPCAMWVLITFLIALSQIKNRKKMAMVAGTFIIAETVMYFLILNLWSSAWDFIGMQKIVTIIIGLVAIGAGIYFLYKAYKNKGQLVCDSSSSEHQTKVINKIQDIATNPFTLWTILSILFLAFSVNIIEFACSAGIPQTFTKILDMNNLSFIQKQFYILIYTILYMIDDLIVFGLAIWGSSKFYQFGAKYSHITTIIAGVLILFLGIALVFFPQVLIF